ncbi:MAG: lipid A deacylase LpxR family protein [Pedobacter sp.]|nr:MAG: lipid A deacylase LpxR family protein [Pedobacter sp.]
MPLKIKSIPSILLILVLTATSFSSHSQSYKNEIGFMTDNDFYIAFKQDRYYTTGTFAYFRRALNQENVDPKFEKKILDLEIGQKIYNAFWSHAPDVTTHDRPFAGYLYGGAGLSWFNKDESILKASAQLGILGPGAMGEEVQSSFHKLINAYYSVEGWDYQVKNEIALNLDFSYQRLLFSTKNRLVDVSGSTNVLLGNTFSGANAGVLIRFGKMNSFFESSYSNSRLKNNQGDNRKPDFELFLFTKPQVNFAAYDATIQGGLFRSDKGPVTFGIKNWVYSQQIGFNLAIDRLTTKFIVTLKTNEVESAAKNYHYGSIVFTYSLNSNRSR